MKLPDITVVTPHVPDRGELLREAIESVRAQTHPAAAHLIDVDYQHHGPHAGLNRMIRAADTEWVSILPDDDLYDPNHLEELSKVADGADIVFSWHRWIGRDDPVYRGEFSPRRLLSRQDAGIRGVFLLRKAFWEQLGGYNLDVVYEDHDFLCRAVQENARVRQVRKVTWTYRFHDRNLSLAVRENDQGLPMTHPYHLARRVASGLST